MLFNVMPVPMGPMMLHFDYFSEPIVDRLRPDTDAVPIAISLTLQGHARRGDGPAPCVPLCSITARGAIQEDGSVRAMDDDYGFSIMFFIDDELDDIAMDMPDDEYDRMEHALESALWLPLATYLHQFFAGVLPGEERP